MSDDEREESPAPQETEAELALKKRREQKPIESAGLDSADKELLANNRQERNKMDDEIKELRQRNEKRKKEREIEEKRLAAERSADDARRKADEEERKRKKEEDELRIRERELKKWPSLKNGRRRQRPTLSSQRKSLPPVVQRRKRAKESQENPRSSWKLRRKQS
jgi:troponin T